MICARKLRNGETPEEMSTLVKQSTVSGTTPDNAAPYTGGGDYENLSGSAMDELLYETEESISYLYQPSSGLIEE